MAQTGRLLVCPIGNHCKAMMDNPLFAVVLAITGTTLVTLGILIIVWPSAFLWLVAGLIILAGSATLLMANRLRSFRFRRRRANE